MSSRPFDHDRRMERVALALDGLSVGDAFGQRFFYLSAVETRIGERDLPTPPWPYTDDTEMALGIAEVLDRHGRIEQDDLAATFGRRFGANPSRGYGGTAFGILAEFCAGMPWREVSGSVFDGMGSMGNGGAMRVAPVGAYFADDLTRVVEEARASAEVTHAHHEGQAGAIAIAVAAAWAWQRRETGSVAQPAELFKVVLEHTPQGETRRGIEVASVLSLDLSVTTAVSRLGNGSQVIAPDTVPFTLWCAARHLDSFVDAMWATISGLGDRDTTCAIVGGIVALACGPEGIPPHWLAYREPLE